MTFIAEAAVAMWVKEASLYTSSDSVFTIGWVLWLLWFVVEEGIALTRHGGDTTLSAHVWDWFSIKPRTQGTTLDGFTRARHAALLLFMTWLLTHFVTGGWV